MALDCVALNRALVFQQNGVVVNNAIRYIRRHLQAYHHMAGAIGWIKVGNFAKSGHKLGYLYLLTPRGIKEKTIITASFLAKKRHEYEVLRQEILRLEVELEDEPQTANSVND